MRRARLQHGDSDIEVHHQGAHLSSWRYQNKEQLFLSRDALFKPTKAIRGGVPICFPQFGAFGPGQQHGFARNVFWQAKETAQANRLRFELSDDKGSREHWPHKFNAQFDLLLETNTLSMCLQVKNTGDEAFEFTAALHTYFHVESVKQVIVGGLQSCAFWDNGTSFEKRQHQEQNELRIETAIDRVYFNTVKPLTLTEPNSNRLIESQGFADTVIWNPWHEGASAFTDMADDEYQNMLCIESANVQTPVRLKAGETWQGQQKITVS